MQKIALETFKIINKISPLFLQDLIEIKKKTKTKKKNIRTNSRYSNTAEVSRTTRFTIKSFDMRQQSTLTLPNETRNDMSYNKFSSYIQNWCAELNCNCSSCRVQPLLLNS
jgi:hypothetical protein